MRKANDKHLRIEITGQTTNLYVPTSRFRKYPHVLTTEIIKLLQICWLEMQKRGPFQSETGSLNSNLSAFVIVLKNTPWTAKHRGQSPLLCFLEHGIITTGSHPAWVIKVNITSYLLGFFQSSKAITPDSVAFIFFSKQSIRITLQMLLDVGIKK